MTAMTSFAPVTRVVAASDLSDAGENALREALRLTKSHSGSRVYAVHVIPEKLVGRLRRRLDTLDQEMTYSHRALDAQLQRAGSSAVQSQLWSRQVQSHVVLGNPAELIHQMAVDIDADLIVLGTSRTAGMGQGQVSKQLMRLAALPVLVARPKTTRSIPHSVPLAPPSLMQNVRWGSHTENSIEEEEASLPAESYRRPSTPARRWVHISGLL